jgi:hypothetical protein
MLSITKHARTRLQQRRISTLVVENLLNFGRQMHDHHGGTVLYFDHRARRRLQRQVPPEDYRRIEPQLNAYAVVAGDGVIITAAHRTRRIIRH